MIFSLLSFVFSRGITGSLDLIENSERLKQEALLFWDLQRKILGAKNMLINGESIFMFTSGGTYYEGVVKSAYVFEDGVLYYYEFPYPYGAIDEVEEDKLIELGRFEEFRIVAIRNNREFEFFSGIPDRVKVIINGKVFVFDTLR